MTTAVSDRGNDRLRVGLYGDIEPVEENSTYAWQLLCLDKKSGRVLWNKTAHQGIPKGKRHPKSSHANSTPATDGKHVTAFFGAEGLFCFNFSGELLWKKEFDQLDSGYFEVPGAQWGFGSSPVIYSNLVIVQCDVQTNSFLAAYDVVSGRQKWRTVRHDVPTWSTPTVDADRSQIVVNGFHHGGGYDLQTGKELWKLRVGGDIPVPTPIIAGGLVFLTSAHGRSSPIYAIRRNATGDISLRPGTLTNASVAWSVNRGGNYMQTPMVIGDYYYGCRDNGVVTCYRVATGEQQYSERLGNGRTGFTASPVAADRKIYYTSEEGSVYVVPAGGTFSVSRTNELGETCLSTPAISEGSLFFRTRHHLMAFGSKGR